MKKMFFIIGFIFLFAGFFSRASAFTITVQPDNESLKNIPVLIKVEIDGIPRTIGDNNFQDITKVPFETTLLQKAKVKITCKIGTTRIKKEFTPKKAQIFIIKKIGDTFQIQ